MGDSGKPSTSNGRPNRFGKKTMLCIWWDQKDVVYPELLKTDQTVNTVRYCQPMINLNYALIEKRPKSATRNEKVILKYDNTPLHTTKAVRDIIFAFNWEHLPHPLYTHQTWPLLSTTCFYRCFAHYLWNTVIFSFNFISFIPFVLFVGYLFLF